MFSFLGKNNDEKAESLFLQAKDLHINQGKLKEAVKLYRKAADLGNIKALHNLGVMIFSGDGVTQDKEVGLKYVIEAYNASPSVDTESWLGLAFLNAAGESHDIDNFLYWTEKAANHGDSRAQDNLGVFFRDGLFGTEINKDKAFYWFFKAAENGFAESYNNLSGCYFSGFGVEANTQQALFWLNKSVEAGNPRAFLNLGKLYLYGDCDLEQDMKRGFSLIAKAVEMKDELAYCLLGICYEEGLGVERDCSKAVFYYQEAVEHGDSFAQLRLGICYTNGIGVEPDFHKAAELFILSALQGNEDAIKNASSILIQLNDDRAFEWSMKAADKGSGYGNFLLGQCYYKGIGCSKDIETAISLFKFALKSNEENTISCINNLCKQDSDLDKALSDSPFDIEDLRNISDPKKQWEIFSLLSTRIQNYIHDKVEKLGFIDSDLEWLQTFPQLYSPQFQHMCFRLQRSIYSIIVCVYGKDQELVLFMNADPENQLRECQENDMIPCVIYLDIDGFAEPIFVNTSNNEDIDLQMTATQGSGILSSWEIRHYGVAFVTKALFENGCTDIEYTDIPHFNPCIFFKYKNQSCYMYIHSHPSGIEEVPKILKDVCNNQPDNTKGYYADVSLTFLFGNNLDFYDKVLYRNGSICGQLKTYTKENFFMTIEEAMKLYGIDESKVSMANLE